jgi:hypothetical protein
MIRIDSICTVGKSLSAKLVKADDQEAVTCRMKFESLEIDRDTLDELLGMPVGWCTRSLYDAQGAPIRRFGITVNGRDLRLSGTLSGPREGEKLTLLQAQIEKLKATLTALGAQVEGVLMWPAKGDEVEDIEKLFGKVVKFVAEVTDGEQDDMFNPQHPNAATSRKELDKALAGMTRPKGDRPGAAP